MNHEKEINEIMSWLDVISRNSKNSQDFENPENQSILICVKEIHLAIVRHNYRVDAYKHIGILIKPHENND